MRGESRSADTGRRRKQNLELTLEYESYKPTFKNSAFNLSSKKTSPEFDYTPLKDLIWQCAIRVYLSPNSRLRYKAPALPVGAPPQALNRAQTHRAKSTKPTELEWPTEISWPDVIGVDAVLPHGYTCSICLEGNMLCPRVTSCGHVFCWLCYLAYEASAVRARASASNKSIDPDFVNAFKCPLCAAPVAPGSLKVCRVQRVPEKLGRGIFVKIKSNRETGEIVVSGGSERLFRRLQWGDAETFLRPQFFELYHIQLTSDDTAQVDDALSLLTEELKNVCGVEDAEVLLGIWAGQFHEALESASAAGLRSPWAAAMAALRLKYPADLVIPSAPSVVEWKKLRADDNVDLLSDYEGEVEVEDEDVHEEYRQQEPTTSDAISKNSDNRTTGDVSDPQPSLEMKRRAAPIAENPPTTPPVGSRSVTADPAAGECDSTSVGKALGKSEWAWWYQLYDGRLVFASPLACRMIIHASGCCLDSLPDAISLRCDEGINVTVGRQTKNKFCCLSGQPWGMAARIVEDLPRVPSATAAAFAKEIRTLKERRRREEVRRKRAEKVYEEYIGAKAEQSYSPPCSNLPDCVSPDAAPPDHDEFAPLVNVPKLESARNFRAACSNKPVRDPDDFPALP